jgi:leader peptidase (prepilin peptidase)/N-methyltransferase
MEVILVIFLFALAACVGSFLNVVIWRMPRGESIVFPGSHCPACGRGIHWYDNIPLLSWLVLRGHCRACKAPISPRYLVVEATTAVMVTGLYAWFYVFRMRQGAGEFLDTWPAWGAYAALFCGLLASSLVDIECWMIPLEVCWFVSLVGLVAAGAAPPPVEMLPRVDPATGALALGAGVGLVAALILLRYGYIQRSFLDADDKPAPAETRERGDAETRRQDKADAARKGKAKKNASGQGSGKDQDRPRKKGEPVSVGFTKADGVNPRREILRELTFLAPAIVLGVAAWMLVTGVPSVRQAWLSLTGPAGGPFGQHFNAVLAAISGFLVGGAWIWGFRIAGTLAFGREAMGLGDVHILAAVGAVCGWIVPSVAFFLAAFLALAWALTIFFLRRQRELPYGPWLAAAALVTVLFYDKLMELFRPYVEVIRMLRQYYGEGGT